MNKRNTWFELKAKVDVFYEDRLVCPLLNIYTSCGILFTSFKSALAFYGSVSKR